MNENPLDLLPELLLLGGAVLGLLAGIFAGRERQGVVAWICGVALAGSAMATGFAMKNPEMMAFDAYAVDLPTNVARITVALGTLLLLPLARNWARGAKRETEVYALLLLAALGAVLLAGAADLLVLVAAYLLAGIPSYALAGFARDAPGTEAALKYYLMGAFLGVLMLAGVTLILGTAGGTAYDLLDGSVPVAATVMLLAGLLFKAGGVPGHFWVPDVAEGASRPIAAFVTTVPKIGAFVALFRLSVLDQPLLLAVLAAATMTLGNLAAFYQDNVRRLLGYSTISQAGYLLVPVAMAGLSDLAEPALLFYLAAYAVTNIGAFAVVAVTGLDRIADYRGLAGRSPWAAFALVVCLLGLVGTPPAAVFVGKVLMFGAAWDGGYAWLAVLAAVNTLASLFYYLRWIRPVFTAGAGAGTARGGRWGLAVVAAGLSIVLGIASGLLLVIPSWGINRGGSDATSHRSGT
ncbi:NADH-quinone oxidoreductase subunit N [Nonomuraea sp. NBC_01738]|uniref:NADH-quinone oxidoreductase subunit N n=1 Tax=Nonomuraea sp. NBC_01738 TaxID=2976003 RepID=UPI002E0ECF2E|nr:NADH-quinone oxidoreductase subunit N [Nonomuraea sp. NBC_01738]